MHGIYYYRKCVETGDGATLLVRYQIDNLKNGKPCYESLYRVNSDEFFIHFHNTTRFHQPDFFLYIEPKNAERWIRTRLGDNCYKLYFRSGIVISDDPYSSTLVPLYVRPAMTRILYKLSQRTGKNVADLFDEACINLYDKYTANPDMDELHSIVTGKQFEAVGAKTLDDFPEKANIVI